MASLVVWRICIRGRKPGARVAGVQQRQQRHHAAFAAVVGAQDQQCVFQGNDQDQCPQDQRRHPEDRVVAKRAAMGGRLGGLFSA